MKINPVGILLMIVSAIVSGCNTRSDSGDKIEYELVSKWPQLSSGYTLGQPTGIGVDSNEHIFVFHRAGRKWTTPFPDSLIAKNTILELENETGKILNSWGANFFIMPHGLTVDHNNHIWVTDVGLHQIFKFSHDGELLMELGIPKISGNDSLHFNLPTDVAVAADGSFYVSDGYGNSRVVKFSSSGKYLFEWGTPGKSPGEFDTPHGITLDQSGNVFVADRENNRIQVFDSHGAFIKELRNNESVAQLPSITMDRGQNLFAIDYDNTTTPDSLVKGSTIIKYEKAESILFHFGATGEKKRTPSWFHDISVDRQGNLYVGDIIGNKILKYKIKPL
jgi:peptidylamidoglycolate lyase